MQRKRIVYGITVMLLSAIIVPSAGAMAMYGGVLETDPEVFAVCCEATRYTPPDSYALEGFGRIDVNDDGIVDMIASLIDEDGGGRILLLAVSGSNGYTVIENRLALPTQTRDSAEGDVFLGFSAEKDRIVLHTSAGGSQQINREYAFQLQERQFRLATVTTVAWDTETGTAERQQLDLLRGESVTDYGTINQDAFVPTSEGTRHRFSADTYAPALATFDLSSVPTSWEALSPIVGGELPDDVIEDAAPAAVQSRAIFCNACGQWFATDEDFQNHPCVVGENPKLVQCTVCGEWFEPGDAFDRHVCPNATKAQRVRCDICGESFEEGAAFRNHICVSRPKAGQVFCDICSGWFDEGDAFRNHVCVPKEAGDP